MMEFQQGLDWITLLISLVWAIGLALDYRYRTNRFKIGRALLWTFAMLCILFLYLKPYQFQVSKDTNVAILGDEFTSKTDSLRDAGFTILPASDYHSALFSENISILSLMGHTLEIWELHSVSAQEIHFTPSSLAGVIGLYIPKTIYNGERTQLKFTVREPTSHVAYLSLNGELLDSAKANEGETQIELSFTPRASGNFRLRVIGANTKDTLYNEPLALTVANPYRPAALMLNSNPNFEARFLKNHLGDLGYAISVKTRISEEISNQEFINSSRKSLNYLSKEVLAEHKLLIMDKDAYDLLGNREKRNILKQNATGSLGILIISTTPESMNGLWTASPGSREMKVQLGGVQLTAYHLNWPKITPMQLEKETIGYYEQNGVGKIGLLSVSNLYQLTLEGQDKIYDQVIKELTQPLMPYQYAGQYIMMDEIIHFGEKTPVQFVSEKENPTILLNGTTHPVRESALRPNLYETEFWPLKSGWDKLVILPDSIKKYYYTYDTTSWLAKTQFENNEYHKWYSSTFTPSNTPAHSKKVFISEWYFLVGFICCISALWIEQRFFNP